MTKQLKVDDMAFSDYGQVPSTVKEFQEYLKVNFAPPWKLEVWRSLSGGFDIYLRNSENFITPKTVCTRLSYTRWAEMQDKPELLVQFLEDLEGSIS